MHSHFSIILYDATSPYRIDRIYFAMSLCLKQMSAKKKPLKKPNGSYSIPGTLCVFDEICVALLLWGAFVVSLLVLYSSLLVVFFFCNIIITILSFEYAHDFVRSSERSFLLSAAFDCKWNILLSRCCVAKILQCWTCVLVYSLQF